MFFSPRKSGEKRSFLGRLDFVRPLAHAGGCTEKKERSSTQKMTKISKIPSLLASDTAKGPCKHNRLYLCVGGSIPNGDHAGVPPRDQSNIMPIVAASPLDNVSLR